MSKRQMRVQFDLTDHEIKPRFIDGQQVPGWENGPSMADYIKQLGSEGWVVADRLDTALYVFEREQP
jgi:hypothetical protein